MPTRTRGTISALRAYRNKYNTMAAAVADLSNLGYSTCLAADITSDLAELGDTLFGVPLPCLVCKQEQVVEVQVADPARTEPDTVICDTCGEGIRLLIVS
jgi:hypothetical protein